MTNAQIILTNRVFLMQEGVIKAAGTGETIEIDGMEVEMPEEIMTYNEWFKRGYQVQKGQHAVAKFKIWMPKKNKKAKAEAEAGDEPKDEEEKQMQAKGFYKKTYKLFYSRTG